jgi:hypothetical protein
MGAISAAVAPPEMPSSIASAAITTIDLREREKIISSPHIVGDAQRVVSIRDATDNPGANKPMAAF